LGLWKSIHKKAKRLKRQGVRKSLQSFECLIHDWWFDRQFGVQTKGKINLSSLGVKTPYLEKDKRQRSYQATRVRAFRKLMATLAPHKDNVFVDLGSGMGRMLLLAMEYGFRKAVGVELSSHLCRIARRNIEIYRENHPTRTEVEIVESDVMEYDLKDDESVYFLFNPFSDEVMGVFFEKLRLSLENRARQVWIIYNNPVYQEYFHSLDYIHLENTFVYGGSIFHIYSNRAARLPPEHVTQKFAEVF
jgi:SAM-dependent methyltransferase